MSTRDVQVMLGNITQGRVSQLVREGKLVAERDSEGRYRYDRDSVERLARERAARFAENAQSADERRALHDEARDRFKRQREREREAERQRQSYLDELRDREVRALEGIWECLRRQR